MLENYYEHVMTGKEEKGKKCIMEGDSRAKRCVDSKGEAL